MSRLRIDIQQGEVPACLKDLASDSVDGSLTDPSYGLSDIPPIREVIAAWLAGEDYDHKPGFLQRNWDQLPPGPHHWQEVYRILKPGALLVAFSSSRTMGLLDLSLRLAGFEILPSLCMLTAQAMAQGAAVDKLIDKAAGVEREVGQRPRFPDGTRGARPRPEKLTGGVYGNGLPEEGGVVDITAPATPLAKAFAGYHSRIRGVWEPALVARKPLDGPLQANAERWGLAGFNAGACRVPVEPADAERVAAKWTDSTRKTDGYSGGLDGYEGRPDISAGRFPSNALIGCHCQGEHSEDCPVRVLREQGKARGIHSAGAAGLAPGISSKGLLYPRPGRQPHRFGDGDKCDRFFFTARSSTRERNAGLSDFYWRRDPDHPDGWLMIGREEWEAIGERDLCAHLDANPRPPFPKKRTHLLARLEARDFNAILAGVKAEPQADWAKWLRAGIAARERNRAQGSPHPTMKSLELIQYIARLILPPTLPDRDPPKLLIPYSGVGSEVVGAMLGGWRHIVARERSPQWTEVAKVRAAWWVKLLEAGAEPDVRQLLGEGDELHKVLDPTPATITGPLFRDPL